MHSLSRSIAVVRWVVIFGIGSLVCASAWLWLFSTFATYDDEGYVLLSLRGFAQAGALYDRVYSQYGPFFFLACDAARRLLGFAWNSTSARWFALTCWIGGAATCAAWVGRRSGALSIALLVFALVFVHLIHDVYEPSHPGALAVWMVALATWAGDESRRAGTTRGWTLVGVLGASLALTKINVGGLLLIAAGCALVLQGHWLRRSAAYALIGPVLGAVPWLLMRTLLGDAAVFQHALIATLGIAGVIVAMSATPRGEEGVRAVLALVAGAVCASVIVLALALLSGSSPGKLLDGIVLDPLNHPLVNFIPVALWRGALVSALAGTLLVFACASHAQRRWAVRVALAVRVGLALVVAHRAVSEPSELGALALSYGVGLAGLCALPTRFDTPGIADARSRQWLALVFALQSLQAYPTAGSQVSWGTFLLAALVTLAVRDAWLACRTAAWPIGRGGVAFVAAIAIALAGITSAAVFRSGLRAYRSGEPLALPGAERLALPLPTALTLRTLSENAHAHAGVLFSLRGKFSFNVWSERPTPTFANATFWPELIKPDAQREIQARLQSDARAAIIKGTWDGGPGELAAFITREFRAAFEINGYQFLVHRGRHVAPLSTARIRQSTPDEWIMEIVLARPAAAISRVELRRIDTPQSQLRVALGAGSPALEETPLAPDGSVAGASRVLDWPALVRAPLVRLRARSRGKLPDPEMLGVFLFSGERRIATAPVLR